MYRMQGLIIAASLLLGPMAMAMAMAMPATTSTPVSTNTPPRQPAPPRSITPTVAELAAWTADCKVPGEPHPFRVVLDGKSVSRARRQAALAKLEQCAQDGNVSAQTFVGSLYWMGDALPDALLKRNPGKAVTYLSNAAAHGCIIDMAKLAEIEIAENRPEAAWIWAHLFSRYALVAEPKTKTLRDHDDAYLGDLLAQVNADIDRNRLHDAIGDATAFMAYYGPDIEAYQVQERFLHQAYPDPRVLQSGQMHFHHRANHPNNGLADYLVAINPDGTVAHTWNIDAFPIPRLAGLLRPTAAGTRFAPASNPALRFMVLPVEYSNSRYTRCTGTIERTARREEKTRERFPPSALRSHPRKRGRRQPNAFNAAA